MDGRVLIINMKKHRKVGNATSTNFYTSEFQLKSTEFPKESRQRKINTTFSNFHHQLFQEEPKPQQRYHSKESKPIIEQLKFLSAKEDNFKLPQSVTKRSISKNKEQSRLKLQEKVKDLYSQHYQEVPPAQEETDRKKPYYQFAAAKRMKQVSNKNSLKEKLEKTALEKFNQAVLKENQQNQNVVSEKNAQSLYRLLKTARMNQLKSHHLKQHRVTTENQSEITQQLHRKEWDAEDNQRVNARKQSDNYQQSENQSNKGKKIKEVAKSKESLFKQVDDRPKEHVQLPQSMPEQTKKPDIPKPKTSIPPPPTPPAQNNKPEVIKFQKVQCDNSIKEKFSSSEQEQSSDFGQQLGEKSKISFNLQIKSKQENKPQPYKPPTQTLPQQNIRKQSIKLPQNSSATNEQKKQSKPKINPQPKKPQTKQKKCEQSDFDNIPSAQAFDKPLTGKQIHPEKATRKGSAEYNSLNNNKIEKVLTPKHLEQPTIKTAPKINPPPKLQAIPDNRPSIGKPVHNHPIQDDQLEEIDLAPEKNKKELAKQPASKKELPPPAFPSKQQQPKKDKKQQPKKVEAASQPIQRQQQQQQQQESSLAQLQNELTYFIQRIQDVGQYRINSKDVYNDKSIDKELLQINKICAYYMAHQFMYLAKWTANYFKSNNFINDYYTLSTDDLKMLQERGILQAEIQNLEGNIEQSKKLLKKCYEECKTFLKKQQQILVLDGKTNYHIRCCATIIRQFKKVYELLQKSPKNTVMLKRCVYLIEMYCALKLLNGQELKEYEEFEDIEDPLQHIETHKRHLLSL